MAKQSFGPDQLETQAPRFAITVTFEINEKQFSAFLPLIHENARASVRDEPGCLRFDVLLPTQPRAQPAVFLYEVYESRAAFDAHLASSHYRTFDAATQDMIAAKSVDRFEVFENVKG